jgi:hypothetical protein
MVALFLPCQAFAQDFRRCVSADGSVVFTDKSCLESQTEKQVVAEIPITNSASRPAFPLPESCNHSASGLLYNVRTAIDTQNVNQLAKYYHWVGLSDVQAKNVLTRLEQLVSKPLADIRLIQAYQASAPVDTIEPEIDAEIQVAEPPSSPIGLKVIQFQSNNTDLESTQFRLQRNFNCWWIRY